MSKFKNITASLAGRGSTILLTLLLTPYYIKTLGFEAYGLVGFFAVVTSVATLFELGLPLALNRAVAQFSSNYKNADHISQLIKSFERFFYLCSILFGLLSIPFSYLIATYWFNFETLQPVTVIVSIILIFLLAALRMPIGVYLAVLGGLQLQVRMNVLVVTFATLRLGSAALVIWIWNASIVYFFATQIFATIIELSVTRHIAWSSRPEFNSNINVSWRNFKDQIRLAITIGGVTVLGILLLQIDKVILSKALTLTEFGQYSAIALIATGIITIGYPIGNVSYPHFSMLKCKNDVKQLLEEFRQYLNIVKTLIVPLCVSAAFFGEDILVLYLDGAMSTPDVFNAFSIFILAAVFGAMRPIPYGMLLALGKEKIVLKYYTGLALFYPALLIYLISELHLTGAAIGFLILQILSIFVFTYLVLRSLVSEKRSVFLLLELVLPIAICLLFAFSFGYMLIKFLPMLNIILSMLISYVSTTSFWFVLFVDKKHKLAILQSIKKVF